MQDLNMNQKQMPTENLENILKQAKPRDFGAYLKENANEMFNGEKPFYNFIRDILDKNNISQHDMFLTVGVSESYGYKILDMTKRTKNRDLILRFCLAAHMELVEVNRALKLYGMAPLYPKTPRDAALIIIFNTHMYNFADADELLEQYGFEPLYDYNEKD